MKSATPFPNRFRLYHAHVVRTSKILAWGLLTSVLLLVSLYCKSVAGLTWLGWALQLCSIVSYFCFQANSILQINPKFVSGKLRLLFVFGYGGIMIVSMVDPVFYCLLALTCVLATPFFESPLEYVMNRDFWKHISWEESFEIEERDERFVERSKLAIASLPSAFLMSIFLLVHACSLALACEIDFFRAITNERELSMLVFFLALFPALPLSIVSLRSWMIRDADPQLLPIGLGVPFAACCWVSFDPSWYWPVIVTTSLVLIAFSAFVVFAEKKWPVYDWELRKAALQLELSGFPARRHFILASYWLLNKELERSRILSSIGDNVETYGDNPYRLDMEIGLVGIQHFLKRVNPFATVYSSSVRHDGIGDLCLARPYWNAVWKKFQRRSRLIFDMKVGIFK